MKKSTIAVLLASASLAVGQGSLSPSGAPATGMKSLGQLECRTPISALPYTITTPGSYYLTDNLSTPNDGITIATNNVTLDLNGFTISTTAPSAQSAGTAIKCNMAYQKNVTIINGNIVGDLTYSGGTWSGPGFYTAISGTVINGRVKGISVNGCWYGITMYQQGGNIVEDCLVNNVAGLGIQGQLVKGCIASGCGGTAIQASLAIDCRGECTGSGNANGIYGEVVANSKGTSTGNGFALRANAAQNCYAVGSTNGLTSTVAQNVVAVSHGISNSVNSALYISVGQNNHATSPYGAIAINSDVATGSYATSPTGVGINAPLAVGCRLSAGTASISWKYNMP